MGLRHWNLHHSKRLKLFSNHWESQNSSCGLVLRSSRILSNYSSRLAVLSSIRGTKYHALSKTADAVPIPNTVFSIRRLGLCDAAEDFSCYGDEEAARRFRETIGDEGYSHFVAFYENSPVASARMFVHDGLAYLCDAGTLELHRGRGAQTALIAARLNYAAELGCSDCAVETLGLLKTALNNLLRAGFVHSFDKKVYAYGD